MFVRLKTFILLGGVLVIFSAAALGQKRNAVQPPSGTATLAQTQEWLIGAVGKYGSYKTRVESVTLSNVKFRGCEFSFTHARKSGSVSTATMGPTRTVYSAKNDISIQVDKVRPDGISLVDHIYPELQTINVWMTGFDLKEGSTEGRIYEIIVKREAGDAIKTALIQLQRLCRAQNETTSVFNAQRAITPKAG